MTYKYLQPKFLLWFVFVITINLHAQVANQGPLYVHDYGSVYLDGTFHLSTTTTKTSRSPINYGKIIFGSSATWLGASNTAFIDGYIQRAVSGGSFIYPLGHDGIYAPVKVTPTTAASITSLYTHVAPTGNLDLSVGILSSEGYWKISGGTATFSLSWGSSTNIGTLTNGQLANLTIVGYNGNAWVQIPSNPDSNSIFGQSSTIAAGSITTTQAIDLSAYTMFGLASKGGCAPQIVASGITKTWNGQSWSPSSPALADNAVINGPFSGTLQCYDLTLNADIDINDGQNIEIANAVYGTGTIRMSGLSNVMQHSATGQAPKIELLKETGSMRRFDYAFITNPINDPASFFTQISSPNNVAVNGLFGTQPRSAFSDFKTLNSAGVPAAITTGIIGKGMRALVSNQAPYSIVERYDVWAAVTDPTQKKTIVAKIKGTANNGDIAAPLLPTVYSFIGNPYPSAIDGAKLLEAAGDGVRQTLYYWAYATPMSATYKYSNNDFSTWTKAGGVAACEGCPVPDGTIGTMQGVYVKGNAAGANNFSFTNCMRIASGGMEYLRQEASKDRYWVSMLSDSGSFSQVLTAYDKESNVEFDHLDGARINTLDASVMSSLIGTGRYAIQSRGNFNVLDVVPLNIVRKNNDNLTISLTRKEGIFEGDEIKIYIHDKEMNIYFDLAQGNFSTNDAADVDNTRYELVYSAGALNTIDPKNVGVAVFSTIKDQKFIAEASKEMAHIDIYDMAGRKIMSFDARDKSVQKPFNYAQGMYVAKIKLVDGTVTSNKLINK